MLLVYSHSFFHPLLFFLNLHGDNILSIFLIVIISFFGDNVQFHFFNVFILILKIFV